MTSKKSGQLKIGEVVEVVEQQTNEKGVLRMRIGERGWASARAGDGTVILVAEEEEDGVQWEEREEEERRGAAEDDDGVRADGERE